MKLPEGITLKPAVLSEDYIAKFQITCNDIVQIYKDDKLVSDNLYRVGGMFSSTEDYFILLKQVEVQYSSSTMKSVEKHDKSNGRKPNKNPNYLNNCSCILDKNGMEKTVGDSYTYYYLRGGIIASVSGMGNSRILNIETGEVISTSSKYFDSSEYVFIDNTYDFRDCTRRGIIQVTKKTGEYIIH